MTKLKWENRIVCGAEKRLKGVKYQEVLEFV